MTQESNLIAFVCIKFRPCNCELQVKTKQNHIPCDLFLSPASKSDFPSGFGSLLWSVQCGSLLVVFLVNLAVCFPPVWAKTVAGRYVIIVFFFPLRHNSYSQLKPSTHTHTHTH